MRAGDDPAQRDVRVNQVSACIDHHMELPGRDLAQQHIARLLWHGIAKREQPGAERPAIEQG